MPLTGTGTGVAMIPPEVNTKLRSLAHDLSNSIETIMQASYLLAQTKLDDSSKRWLELIDNATRDAARINREIREILRAQSAPTKP
jgi:signal transduction histidine kinase